MLGRTDSRRRLLFLLVRVRRRALALVARTGVLAGRARATALMAAAVAQTTVRIETARAGAARSTTGPGSSCWPRPSTASDSSPPPTSSTPERTDPTARRAGPPARARRSERAATAARAAGERQAVRRSSPASIEPDARRPHPRGGPRRPDLRRSASSPSRCGSIRRPAAARIRRLAAHLLGFVNREGAGQYGVEQYYQDQLAGQPRVLSPQRDVNGRAMPETADRRRSPASPGEDLRLTIDAGLQLAVEQELLAAWVADRAKSVSAVVMDPYTGEVYAEATYPSYDANDYRAVAAADPSRFIDPIVSHVYEPGSVFKMMTAAAALESGTVTPKTRIKDVGTLKLDNGQTKIDNADRKGMGWITFEDGIAYSRNVVAAKVALRLGETTAESSAILYDMWLGWASAPRPASTSPARSAASCATRRSSRGARSTWPTARSARAWRSPRSSSRPRTRRCSTAARWSSRTSSRASASEDIATATHGQVLASRESEARSTELMDHVIDGGAVLPRPDPRPGLPRRRQDRHGADLGRRSKGRAGSTTSSTTRSSATSPARRTSPTSSSPCGSRRARPTVARVGQLEMPVMSFELFRRIATDAITTPDLLTDRPPIDLDRRDRPVTGALCDTGRP